MRRFIVNPAVERLHAPVLLREVLDLLRPRLGGKYLDCTVGVGGHAEAILERSGPEGILCGIDRDAEAVALAREHLGRFGGRVRLVHGDFRDISQIVTEQGWGPFDGVLFDLGISSHQLSDPERGFSFLHDGPLDMRMDRSSVGKTAAELVAKLSESELSSILWKYGEERWARRIAKAIVKAREKEPVVSTRQLRELVEKSIPRSAWPRKIHPATRTFQALRIATNDELTGLGLAIEEAVGFLKTGGRIVVISFHSLEDRIVKETFRRLHRAEQPSLRLLTRKPLVPSEEERECNPRCRSAKLRAAERLDNP